MCEAGLWSVPRTVAKSASPVVTIAKFVDAEPDGSEGVTPMVVGRAGVTRSPSIVASGSGLPVAITSVAADKIIRRCANSGT